jgi:hypothetical protein
MNWVKLSRKIRRIDLTGQLLFVDVDKDKRATWLQLIGRVAYCFLVVG